MRRGRIATGLVMVLIVVLAGGAGVGLGLYRSGYFEPVPEPPVIVEDRGVEPVVRALVAEHVDRVRAAPRKPGPWATLGMMYFFNDLVDLAAPCLEQSLALQPNQPRVWYCLARSRAELGDVDGAIAAIDEAIGLSSGDGHDHDHDHAAAPGFLSWRRGFWLLDAGRIEEAEVAFAQARAQNEFDPVARIGQARAAIERQAWAAAQRELESLFATVSEIPNESYAKNLLAEAYTQLGELDMAGEFRSEEPRHSLSWADPWNDAFVVEHRWIESWVMDEALHAIAAGRAADALQKLRVIEPVRSEDPRFLQIIAKACAHTGQLGQALDHIDAALIRKPDDFQALFDRAVLLEQLDRFAEGIDAAKDLLETRPDHIGARVLLGRTLTRGRRFNEALPVLERAVADDPVHPTAWVYLAITRMELGDLVGANEALYRAETLDPEAEYLQFARDRLQAIRDGDAG